MLAAARKFADRVWAVEGCHGIGRHLAHRLVHDGEIVVDVPPKLSAQVRVFATGNGRKTDEAGAHSIALVALRAPGLVQVQAGEDLVVMGMLADRRDELGRARTQVINRLHRLLLELLSGVGPDALATPCYLTVPLAAHPVRQLCQAKPGDTNAPRHGIRVSLVRRSDKHKDYLQGCRVRETAPCIQD